jgi:hypothetical protein
MDPSLFRNCAIPCGPITVDDIDDNLFLPLSYKNRGNVFAVTIEDVEDDGLVFIMNWKEDGSAPTGEDVAPSATFYPFRKLLDTKDFSHCVGCKGGGCTNKVIRPIDFSKPRADFGNYRIEMCGA